MARYLVFYTTDTTSSIEVESDLDPETMDPMDLVDLADRVGLPRLCHQCAHAYELGDPTPVEIQGLDNGVEWRVDTPGPQAGIAEQIMSHELGKRS